jgi:hypothetical protein
MMKSFLSVLLLLLSCSLLHAQSDTLQQDSTYIYSETVRDEEVYEEEAPPVYETSDTVRYFDAASFFIKVQPRQAEDSVIKRLKRDDAYWYADLEPNQKTVNRQNRRQGNAGGRQNEEVYEVDEAEENSGSSGLGNFIWYALLIGFVSLLIWFLASGKFGLWHKKSLAIQQDEAVMEEDIHRLNFEDKIKKAEADRDYRMAVRLWYLFTLKKMTDQQIISYAREKTNHQYVSQLYNTPYYSSFARLTRSFDYVWYGMFPLSPQAYASLVQSFTQFHQELS